MLVQYELFLFWWAVGCTDWSYTSILCSTLLCNCVCQLYPLKYQDPPGQAHFTLKGNHVESLGQENKRGIIYPRNDDVIEKVVEWVRGKWEGSENVLCRFSKDFRSGEECFSIVSFPESHKVGKWHCLLEDHSWRRTEGNLKASLHSSTLRKSVSGLYGGGSHQVLSNMALWDVRFFQSAHFCLPNSSTGSPPSKLLSGGEHREEEETQSPWWSTVHGCCKVGGHSALDITRCVGLLQRIRYCSGS